MAKANSSARMQAHVIPEKAGLKFYALIRRIDAVECMAVCVEMALLERRCDSDRMLAFCVEQNIADELSRISQSAAELMLELGHKPPEHVAKSPLLGGGTLRPLRKELGESQEGREVRHV